MSRFNYIDKIISFESGDLDYSETCKLFQYLVNTGIVWTLQGSYGRNAVALLEAGVITQPIKKSEVKR